MKMEDYYKWEDLALSSIVHLMVKMFDFEEVNTTTFQRHNVESGVWIDVTIKKGKQTWYVSAQRTDILKRRLIELLDNLQIRPLEFKPAKE